MAGWLANLTGEEDKDTAEVGGTSLIEDDMEEALTTPGTMQ